ncbi:MAG: peptide ABC transporter ATP-binding protein [Deltaproteobacteria bacterium]|nr:peptide ABC transporter ATP-binding protein [Deltaproteobacteria bacterium]
MPPLLTIKNLHTHFFLDEGVVRAVDGVDLEIPRGKTLCVVGESGCGKSITAFSLLQMIQRPGRIVDGSITLHRDNGPVELTELAPDGNEMRRIRGDEIAMIFQEPMTSLSPVHTVGAQIAEAIRLHTTSDKREARDRTIHIMARVGIPDPERRYGEYPHELSGGLRQRAMIAMALSCQPRVVIADEPTTALDVTIQAQVLDLLNDLRTRLNTAVILITHDLGVVAESADRVIVMYAGRKVEEASVGELFANPKHPYTRGLLASVPRLGTLEGDSVPKRLTEIPGIVPALTQLPVGCSFAPRCAFADEACGAQPEYADLGDGHFSACWHIAEAAAS